MKRVFASVLCAGVLGFVAADSRAATLHLGTATGGLKIYYNNIDNNGAGGGPDGVISGYDENPGNVAYVRAQVSDGNTDGMAFQFDTTDLGGFTLNDIFSGQPAGSSQFGLDLIATSPTYNGAGGVVIPGFDFLDNVDGTVANAQHTTVMPPSPAAFAVDDYQNASPSGPGNGGAVRNSLFRGTTLALNVTNLTQNGNIYTIDVAGTLTTDGLIHWSNPALSDSVMSAAPWNLGNTLTFTGTFSYDKTGDVGATQTDFYAGSLDVYVSTVPLPSSAAMGMFLLAGTLGMLKLRSLRRQRA